MSVDVAPRGGFGRVARGGDWLRASPIAPALAFVLVLLILPLAETLRASLTAADGSFTLEVYARLLERPAYRQVLRNTLEIAVTVTLLTVVVAYPLAYQMAVASDRALRLWVILLLLPFLTSLLVRTYAWLYLLGPGGPLSETLGLIGIPPLRVLFTRLAVVLGMVYALLPYAALTMAAGMRGFDRSLVRAARSLGAGDRAVLVRVLLPLSLPSIATAALLVFVLASGYFVTPRLLGGDGDRMIGTLIETQVELLLDRRVAGALSAVLLLLTGVCFAALALVLRLRTVSTSQPGRRAR